MLNLHQWSARSIKKQRQHGHKTVTCELNWDCIQSYTKKRGLIWVCNVDVLPKCIITGFRTHHFRFFTRRKSVTNPLSNTQIDHPREGKRWTELQDVRWYFWRSCFPLKHSGRRRRGIAPCHRSRSIGHVRSEGMYYDRVRERTIVSWPRERCRWGYLGDQGWRGQEWNSPIEFLWGLDFQQFGC